MQMNCGCGHAKEEHYMTVGRCTWEECNCAEYQPEAPQSEGTDKLNAVSPNHNSSIPDLSDNGAPKLEEEDFWRIRTEIITALRKRGIDNGTINACLRDLLPLVAREKSKLVGELLKQEQTLWKHEMDLRYAAGYKARICEAVPVSVLAEYMGRDG